MTRQLTELTAPEIAATLGPGSVVVLPVGAVEQHGPHLPVATDAISAASVADAAVGGAVADGVDAWLLPTLSFTKSDEHAWSPGTVWLSWDTLMRTVVDVGRSVATTPAQRLVFLNGHGGNTALLQVAIREVRRLTGLRTFVMPALWTGSPRGGAPAAPDGEVGLGIRGGTAETSLMLHLRPDLVHLDRAERAVPEHLSQSELMGFNGWPVAFGWLSDDFGPSGVIGDPTTATPEYGKALFEFSTGEAAAALAEIAAYRP